MPASEARHRLPAGSAWGEIDSPVGPLGIAVTPDGLLCLAFCSFTELTRMFAVPGADGAAARHRDGGGGDGDGGHGRGARPAPLLEHELGRQVVRELGEYFAGQRKQFTLPVDWSLTSGAQRSILSTLHSQVPFGSTIGYGDLALRSGRTLGASRLVGTVMGSNPVAIVVPCHRVIEADGGIGGFGGGVESKRWLLTHEGSLPPTLF